MRAGEGRLTPREKLIARARHLLALASSPEAHEAASAKRYAEAHVAKHKITAEELALPKLRTIRFADDLDPEERWRERLALEIARKHGCRPLVARGRLFFEGERAIEATVEYRMRIAAALREARAARWDGWTLEVRPRLVVVSGRHPGNYATLFLDGEKMVFRGELSVFDNAEKTYLWAFERREVLREGQRLVFSVADRDVIGEVAGGEISVRALKARVAKDAAGAPMWLESDEW